MATKFYIASRLENAPLVRELRDHLVAAGWECAYDWTVHGSVRGPGANVEMIRKVVALEVDGAAAWRFIMLLPGGRGAHVELGVSLGVWWVLQDCGDAEKGRTVLWSPTPDVDFGVTEDVSCFYHHHQVEQRSDATMGELARWLIETDHAQFQRKLGTMLFKEHRPHIDASGQFQSDKYPTCPPGKVPLSVEDPAAQPLLWQYAQSHEGIDPAFSDDLRFALRVAGYWPAGRDRV